MAENNKIKTTLGILMGFPSGVRDGVLSLASGIADMETAEREELKRTFELVSEYATQRPRKQQKPDGKPIVVRKPRKGAQAGAPASNTVEA